MSDHADIRRRVPRTDVVLADLWRARALRELYAVLRPLRVGRPSVVARVAQGGCLLDLRRVLPDDDDRLVEAVTGVDAEAQRCT